MSNTQFGKMAFPHASHAADPATSYEAEDALTASGMRRSQAVKILAVVKASPGLTGHEIGAATGLGQVPALRRLNDLHKIREVHQGQARIGPMNRNEVTWWPANYETQSVMAL